MTNPLREHPSPYDYFNRYRRWFRELSEFADLYHWDEYREEYAWAQDEFNRLTEQGWTEAAFTQTDWCLLRQPFYHRWSHWDHVLDVMDGATLRGTILDYGCGTGEMLAWLERRRPGWEYDGHDLESPHYEYAKWRGYEPLDDWQDQRYHVVTCYETLEHVREPLEAVESMLKVIRPGGWLLWDFVDDPGGGNVATREERSEVLRRLGGVTGMGEYYRV